MTYNKVGEICAGLIFTASILINISENKMVGEDTDHGRKIGWSVGTPAMEESNMVGEDTDHGKTF